MKLEDVQSLGEVFLWIPELFLVGGTEVQNTGIHYPKRKEKRRLCSGAKEGQLSDMSPEIFGAARARIKESTKEKKCMN